MGYFHEIEAKKIYSFYLKYFKDGTYITKTGDITACDASEAILSLIKLYPGAKGTVSIRK
jgi:hypothetical protein